MIHVALVQCPGAEFAERFMEAFESTVRDDVESGASWPDPQR